MIHSRGRARKWDQDQAVFEFFSGTEHLSKVAEKKSEPKIAKSGLATVSFRQSEHDGKVVVVDLVGFYTGMDILTKYGPRIHSRYFADGRESSMFFSMRDGDRKTVQLYGRTACTLLAVGEYYAGADFLDRIELMKVCGCRLAAIVKAEKAREALSKKVAPAMELRKITI